MSANFQTDVELYFEKIRRKDEDMNTALASALDPLKQAYQLLEEAKKYALKNLKEIYDSDFDRVEVWLPSRSAHQVAKSIFEMSDDYGDDKADFKAHVLTRAAQPVQETMEQLGRLIATVGKALSARANPTLASITSVHEAPLYLENLGRPHRNALAIEEQVRGIFRQIRELRQLHEMDTDHLMMTPYDKLVKAATDEQIDELTEDTWVRALEETKHGFTVLERRLDDVAAVIRYRILGQVTDVKEQFVAACKHLKAVAELTD